MPDLLFIAVTVAFFVAVAGFVSLCDRIIGPDAEHGDPQGVGESDEGAMPADGGPGVDPAELSPTGSRP